MYLIACFNNNIWQSGNQQLVNVKPGIFNQYPGKFRILINPQKK